MGIKKIPDSKYGIKTREDNAYADSNLTAGILCKKKDNRAIFNLYSLKMPALQYFKHTSPSICINATIHIIFMSNIAVSFYVVKLLFMYNLMSCTYSTRCSPFRFCFFDCNLYYFFRASG